MDRGPQTRQALDAFRIGAEGILGAQLDAILLFGSRARQDYREDSDLDLAVVLKDAPDDRLAVADRIMDAVFAPTMDAGRVIQPLILSAEELRQSQHPLIAEIRAHGVPV